MAKIKINVFNLTPLNSIFSCCMVGVYHSSLVIDEKIEYYYGFSMHGCTGIDSPQKVNELPDVMQGTFHSSYEIGDSPYTRLECRDICRKMKQSPEWLSDYYNLIYHNCNDFTYELCRQLVGDEKMQNYPHWVNRGVKVGRFLYSISVSHFLGFIKKLPGFGPNYEPKPAPHTPEVTEEEDIEYAITPIQKQGEEV